MPTDIEWCDESWNPVTGCGDDRIGEGCENCYARAMALRLKAMGIPKYRNGFEVTRHPDELNAKVLRKREPQLIFAGSMGDLFHKDVPYPFIYRVFKVMEGSRHTFVVLTKRPGRAWDYSEWVRAQGYGYLNGLPNVRLGVSVSTQAEADKWIPILRDIPAVTRIVSFEPALERVDWAPHIDGIDWLICGCERGPKQRPFDEDWARNARDTCLEAGVPFFFKQGRGPKNEVVKIPLLDGRQWKEIPNG